MLNENYIASVKCVCGDMFWKQFEDLWVVGV